MTPVLWWIAGGLVLAVAGAGMVVMGYRAMRFCRSCRNLRRRRLKSGTVIKSCAKHHPMRECCPHFVEERRSKESVVRFVERRART